MEQRKQNRAYLLFVGAMIIYGSIGIFRRFVPLSSAFLAFARGLIGCIFLLIWVKATGKSLRLDIGKKRLALLLITGVALGANWMLLFEAYNYTTVAVATLCYYMQPTLLILLSPLVFGERLTVKKGLCAAVSVAGMTLVSGVLDGTAVTGGDVRGILLGLGAAALYTAVIILNKKNPVENAYGKTVVQLFSAAAALIPYLLFTEKQGSHNMDITAAIMLLIVGIVHTGVAYTMYFSGIQRLPSLAVAALSYIDPVVAMLLAGVILKEPMSLTEIIGAILILGATAVSELHPGKNNHSC